MIVTCPRCLTKFNLPEESVATGAKLQLHCSRCGWDFLFSPLDEDGLGPGEIEALLPPVEEEFDVTNDKEANDEVSDFVELEPDGEELQSEMPPSVVEDTPEEVGEKSDSDAIFELSDDFDDEQGSDLEFDEGLDFQEDELEPAAPGNSPKESGDQDIEDLALDLDELNLDDIEFDSFGDEPEPAEGRATTLDDGELDGLLEQVEEPPVEPATARVADNLERKPVEKAEKGPVVKSAKATNTKRNLILVLCCFLVLSLALWAGFGLWKRFSVDMKKHLKLVEVENQRLRLASDRVVIVIRGKVVNSSPKLVTDLKIKGVLLNEAGKAVAEVVTAGGVSFSEEELDRLDAGKLVMLENSAVTLPPNGGELPFMIAFYDYPEKARECYVELSSFKVKKGRRPK